MKTEEFLKFVETQALDSIYKDIESNNSPQPIVLTFYGKTLEIDAHADNHESLCSFLNEVINND